MPQSKTKLILHSLIGLFIGAFSGYAIYNLAFKDIIESIINKDKDTLHTKISKNYKNLINLEFDFIFIVSFSILGACFSTIRCLFSLCFTEFTGKLGRLIIYTTIFKLIVENPIENSVYNIAEMSRALSCAVGQQANNADLMVQSVTRPVNDALLSMTEEIRGLNGSGFSLEESFENLESELKLEDVNVDSSASATKNKNPKKQSYASQYHEKSKSRCFSTFQKATTECQHWLSKKYDSCLKTINIPFIGHALCLALKADFICNLAKIFDPICNDMPEISDMPNYDKNVERIKNLKEKIEKDKNTFEQYWEVPVKYYEDYSVNEFVKNVAETGNEVIEKVHFYRTVFHMVIHTLKQVSALLCLWVLISALIYQRKFISTLDFDNNTITKALKKLDQSRKLNNQKTAFPLSGLLKKNYIDLTKGPKSYFYFDTKLFIIKFANFFFLLLFVVSTFTLEYLTNMTIESINRNSQDLGYEMTTENQLKIETVGDGLVANMVRRLLGGINFDIRFQADSDVMACLPQTRSHLAKDDELENKRKINFKIGLLLSILFILLSLECSLLGKLSRHICSKFFPNREKVRCQYLYFKLLSRQSSRQKRVLQTIKRLVYSQDLLKGNLEVYEKNLEEWHEISNFFVKKFLKKRPKLSCILCGVNLKVRSEVDAFESHEDNDNESMRNLLKEDSNLYLGCNTCKFAWCSGCNAEFKSEKCLICNVTNKN